MQQFIENHWYKHVNVLLSLILLPLSLIFFLISRIRFYCYKFKIFKSYGLAVPVVIIGNISVGGVGKTPLTKYLATELKNRGISVGVILRGYKSKIKSAYIVSPADNSSQVGDEALIYAMNDIRVAIGQDRYQAGISLLKEYPDIQLILSDDGLQHYRLQRDYEIAVIDASRMLGNQFVLPMGPLRESPDRLKSVNMLVINGPASFEQMQFLKQYSVPITLQKLVLDKIYNPQTGEIINIDKLQHATITAMAAIGNPQRFFDFLESIGIKLKQKIAFPDHYPFQEKDILTDSDLILVTEKDYVKLIKFNNVKIWVVLVKPELNSSLLIERLVKIRK